MAQFLYEPQVFPFSELGGGRVGDNRAARDNSNSPADIARRHVTFFITYSINFINNNKLTITRITRSSILNFLRNFFLFRSGIFSREN